MTDLAPREKFILLAYAESHSIWPPALGLDLVLLARKTGYSAEDVRAVMHALGSQPALLTEEP